MLICLNTKTTKIDLFFDTPHLEFVAETHQVEFVANLFYNLK